MPRTRTAGVALLALAALGVLAACGSDDDAAPASLAEQQAAASASPGPSLSAKDQAKQKTIDDAEKFFAEFREAEADAANDGFTGWPRLANDFWDTDMAQGSVPWYQEMADKGQYTTGAPELVSSEVTDYVGEDVGYEQVEFTSCIDISPMHLYEKGGREIPMPNETERSVVVHRVEHQGKGNSWRVTESTPVEGTC